MKVNFSTIPVLLWFSLLMYWFGHKAALYVYPPDASPNGWIFPAIIVVGVSIVTSIISIGQDN